MVTIFLLHTGSILTFMTQNSALQHVVYVDILSYYRICMRCCNVVVRAGNRTMQRPFKSLLKLTVMETGK
jgi:hypothetical protein